MPAERSCNPSGGLVPSLSVWSIRWSSSVQTIFELCGVASICQHNRRRSRCNDSSVTSICAAGATTRTASICEHNRRRSYCKDCWGASICEHNRQRSNCKDCGGTSIFQHNGVGKDCGGASICEHNRIRSQCKECGGASICQHKCQVRRELRCTIDRHPRIKSRRRGCPVPVPKSIYRNQNPYIINSNFIGKRQRANS